MQIIIVIYKASLYILSHLFLELIIELAGDSNVYFVIKYDCGFHKENSILDINILGVIKSISSQHC